MTPDPERRMLLSLPLIVALLNATPLGAIKSAAALFIPNETSTMTTDPRHDFDFLVGSWHVQHRRLKERLTGNTEWVPFDGTCTMQKLLDGQGNVDDNVLNLPEGSYRAVGLRAFDPKTRTWAIWWLDARNPHTMEVPVIGGFADGVGTFLADDTLRGKPIKVRFLWSNITPTTADWAQAFSPDAGKTWETNWVMHFTRTA